MREDDAQGNFQNASEDQHRHDEHGAVEQNGPKLHPRLRGLHLFANVRPNIRMDAFRQNHVRLIVDVR